MLVVTHRIFYTSRQVKVVIVVYLVYIVLLERIRLVCNVCDPVYTVGPAYDLY